MDDGLLQQHAELVSIREFLNSVVQSLEVVSRRNKAYSEVIQTLPNRAEIAGRVQQREATLARSEPEKYSDLLNQGIQAVEAHSLLELAQLGHAIQERVRTWGLA
jgi:hypothetical protein